MAYWPGTYDRTRRKGFMLQCRGDVRLYDGSNDRTPKSRKARALLVILAAEGRPLMRTRLVDLLWSESEEEQGRASLRTLLADLREQFGPAFSDLLVAERERLAIGGGVRTDLTKEPMSTRAGDLFEGLDHLDPVLDEWLRLERQRWSAAPDKFASQSSGSALVRYGPGIALIAAITAIGMVFFYR